MSYYRVLIRGKFVESFAKEIGFFHPMKKVRLDALVLNSYVENSNVDVIPDGNELFRNLRQKLRVSPQELRVFGKDYWAYENNQYRVTRNWFKKIVGFYKKRFEDFCLLKKDVGVLEKIIDFDYEVFLDKLEKLRKLLLLSYAGLVFDLKFSEGEFRKILQKQRLGGINILKEVFSLVNKFDKRIKELSSLSNVGAGVQNVPVFVGKGVVSYAEISRELNIPETSLKSYCYGDVNVSGHLEVLIGAKLEDVKKNLALNLKEAVFILLLSWAGLLRLWKMQNPNSRWVWSNL